MPKHTVTRRVRFSASHLLEHHPGPCRHMHGHNFDAWITVAGELNTNVGAPDEGMVVDAGEILAAVQPLLYNVDHAHLNDVVPTRYLPPTTENVALYIGEYLRRKDLNVVKVHLAETENNSATVEWDA